MSDTTEWAASLSNTMHSSDGLNFTILVYGLLIAGAIFWLAWGLARKAMTRQESGPDKDGTSKRLHKHPALTVGTLMILALFAGALIGIGMDSIKSNQATTATPAPHQAGQLA